MHTISRRTLTAPTTSSSVGNYRIIAEKLLGPLQGPARPSAADLRRGNAGQKRSGTVSEYYISLGLFARLSAIRQRAPRNSFDNNFHGRDHVPESGNLKKYNIDSNCAIIMYLLKMRMPRINLILLEII